MKFGIRKPSFKKRLAARTSWKRYARHSLGIKAPRGYGWFTNPKKAAYNRIYNRTTIDPIKILIKGAKGAGVTRASKVNQLEKLGRMYRRGEIGDQEYAELRADIMQGSANAPSSSGCGAFVVKFSGLLTLTFIGIVMCTSSNEEAATQQDNVPIQTDPVTEVESVPTINSTSDSMESITEQQAPEKAQLEFQKLSPDEKQKANEKLDNLF